MQKKYFGTVIRGMVKGKVFGCPTVNIKLNDNNLHIKNGVYAVGVTIDRGKRFFAPTMYHGMLYVGTRPTLNMQEITIEIHIFDFNEDIYNQQISFEILHKIRNEIQFESIEKLIDQLHQDREAVYEYLKFKV
jgi:riboflavin kinase/FMN adenylyltransferase